MINDMIKKYEDLNPPNWKGGDISCNDILADLQAIKAKIEELISYYEGEVSENLIYDLQDLLGE